MPQTHPHNRGTDQIFENIKVSTVGKAILGLAAIISAIAIIAGSITFFVVTKPELKEVKDSLSLYRSATNFRLGRLEASSDTVKRSLDAILDLQSSSATVTCLQLERERSLVFARAAKLRCDTLVAK